MITISARKADVGGYVGHSAMHPDVLDKGREEVDKDHLPKLIFALLAGFFGVGAAAVGALLLSEAKETRTQLGDFKARLDDRDHTERDDLRKLIFALLAGFFALGAAIVTLAAAVASAILLLAIGG